MCRKMTRPMTGQPETLDELQAANKRANNTTETKGFDEDDDMPEADSLEEYRAKKEEQRNEKSDEEKLAELREFKKKNQDLYDDLEQAVEEAKNDEKKMKVVDDSGEVHTLTKEEVESRRDVNTRTWNRLERNGGMYVRVAHWLNDADVNKVKNGRGFFGHKVGETEKALKFEVDVESTHTAEAETVWVPKSGVQTHELI